MKAVAGGDGERKVFYVVYRDTIMLLAIRMETIPFTAFDGEITERAIRTASHVKTIYESQESFTMTGPQLRFRPNIRPIQESVE